MIKKDIQLKSIVIVLVGDSTVANYAAENELRGWGQIMPEFFHDNIVIKNFAKSGRSSKSFIKEGLWDKAIETKPDYVMIQFGHNDCPDKGERTTDPNSDYQKYLLKYIKDCRKSGDQPILVTPVERRNFDDRGKVNQTLFQYSLAMKKVGKRENVPVIDLHYKSVELYELSGENGYSYMNPTSQTDRTHFTKDGARTITKMVVTEVNRKVPSLKRYLKKNKSK
ncbi:MAG: hypothetical protein A2Y10_10500 [Planctomycetes bacterium GWF2_41_51]|nr:MAG: hypothetical protein A2Y10_10500 [Planctomycetes bacterium GWF2_41_51]HBG26905.1 pectate lyase [Phycisphaerales bacterium]